MYNKRQDGSFAGLASGLSALQDCGWCQRVAWLMAYFVRSCCWKPNGPGTYVSEMCAHLSTKQPVRPASSLV